MFRVEFFSSNDKKLGTSCLDSMIAETIDEAYDFEFALRYKWEQRMVKGYTRVTSIKDKSQKR